MGCKHSRVVAFGKMARKMFGGRFEIPDWEMPEFPTMEEMKAKLFAVIATIISKIPDVFLPESVELDGVIKIYQVFLQLVKNHT